MTAAHCSTPQPAQRHCVWRGWAYARGATQAAPKRYGLRDAMSLKQTIPAAPLPERRGLLAMWRTPAPQRAAATVDGVHAACPLSNRPQQVIRSNDTSAAPPHLNEAQHGTGSTRLQRRHGRRGGRFIIFARRTVNGLRCASGAPVSS